MDRRIQAARRAYIEEPTDENARFLQGELRRSGSILGNRLVFDVHMAANHARALAATGGSEEGYVDIFSHSPRLQEARRNYRLRFPLAGAVYAGLSKDDLVVVLDSLGNVPVPIDIWNGGGYSLHSILDDWDSSEYEDYVIAWRYGNEPGEVYAQEVIGFGANWENRGQAEVALSEELLRSDIVTDEGLLNRIVDQWGSGGPTVEELRSIDGKGFAQLAWDAMRQGAGLGTEDTLDTRKEFKQRFVLWIAMEAQGWL